MSQKIVIQSDFDGSELKPEEHESVLISYNGNNYTLDGTDHQIESVFGDYMKDMFRVRSRSTPLPSNRSSGKSTASGLTREELADARAWLTANGFQVSDRGRIKGELLTKWQNRGAGAPARATQSTAQKPAESKSSQSQTQKPSESPAQSKSAESKSAQSQGQPAKK